ncbi:MAG: cupin domain-containing protein [Acidobacteria bacterium]|nr:cupin domain-containing protein [Acidobacteriota bacterium]
MDKYRVEQCAELQTPGVALMRLVLDREGYSVYQWCDQPETEYGMHFHNEAQSHWIISGQLEITVQSVGTFLLKAGDRDFMPANTYHSARVIGEEPVMYLIGSRH